MKSLRPLALVYLVLLVFSSCSAPSKPSGSQNGIEPSAEKEAEKQDLSSYHTAYFASGCFWCVEAIFESVKGVEEAISGYAGGDKANPTYREVSSGQTRHAEAVEVYYDSSLVDYPTLLKVFFGSHDPTTPNRQGPDAGPQYRSIVFYQTDQERRLAEQYINQLTEEGAFDAPIVTDIRALKKFWKAEDYHQDYERLHPNDSYIRNVSIPRIKRFQNKYPELLKKDRTH